MSTKYSISAICRVIGINRSYIYYRNKNKPDDLALESQIRQIFKDSYNSYGTRKIKHELAEQGVIVSRRRISRIMQRLGLVSCYTKRKYRNHTKGCNEAKIPNLLNRQFDRDTALDVVVSDLTYVDVNCVWHYVCLMIDLWNREVIGWSVGPHKDATLVRDAFYSIPYRLDHINLFHTDRGYEFANKLIQDTLDGFCIARSLSSKGCPYDNSVNESTNKILKTEFIYQHKFHTLEELKSGLANYIYWYNNKRIHSSIGYQTPINMRRNQSPLKNCCKKG